MKIVIIGGHLSPALAVIEKLKGEQVYYLGRKYTFEGDKAISLEYQEVTKLGIPFYAINTGRLQRSLTSHTLPSLLKFPSGLVQSIKVLRDIGPDVVLGFGGYVSLPVVLSAALLKIPVVIHEQTLEAGLANKLEAKLASKICVSWNSSIKYFPKQKVVLTGNPLREVILNRKTVKRTGILPTLYITGGSSGSHAINSLAEKCLGKLLAHFVVIHQVGDAKEYEDYQKLQIAAEKLEAQVAKNYHPRKFFSQEEVADNFGSADLVVGRAGINTVAELIYFAKPAFLIPLPFAQRGEQLKNALFLKELGLAEIGSQNELTPEAFLSALLAMLKNLKSYRLKENVLIPAAAENIIKVLKDVSTKKTA